MCGRFTLRTSSIAELERQAEALALPDEAALYQPRFNVAPTQAVWAVVDTGGSPSTMGLRRASWGLPRRGVPRATLSNARSERLLEGWLLGRPGIRRALVVADGFYEWKGETPHWFHPPSGGLLYLGALIEPVPSAPEGAGQVKPPPLRLVLLTTEASSDVRVLHHRMPVLVPHERRRAWLDAAGAALTDPAPTGTLAVRAASRRVNRVVHDDASCLAPDPQRQLPLWG